MVPSKPVTTIGRLKCLKHTLVVTVPYLNYFNTFPAALSRLQQTVQTPQPSTLLPRADLPPPASSPEGIPSPAVALPAPPLASSPEGSPPSAVALPTPPSHVCCGVCPRYAISRLPSSTIHKTHVFSCPLVDVFYCSSLCPASLLIHVINIHPHWK